MEKRKEKIKKIEKKRRKRKNEYVIDQKKYQIKRDSRSSLIGKQLGVSIFRSKTKGKK